MTELICGKCGEKFQSETEADSDEYCPTCIKEMNDPYPEHTKLQKVQKQSQAIGEFIEWLQSQNLAICEKQITVANEDGELSEEEKEEWKMGWDWMPAHLPIITTLAKYFDINVAKLEQEKRAMLDEIRQHNSPV